MGGLGEVAGVILARAFQRTELAAQNLSNITTPGYKAVRSFMLDSADHPPLSSTDDGAAAQSVDFSEGKLQKTGNPFDLAITGQGFFTVRSDDGEIYFTRDGQFSRGPDGSLVTPAGLTLQSASGGDVTVSQNNPQILSDGTIVENGQPVAQLQLSNFSDLSALHPVGGGLFTAPADEAMAVSAQVQQGMLETSNVSTADEMISIMASLRSAESGQKVVQVYDELLGDAASAFGQS